MAVAWTWSRQVQPTVVSILSQGAAQMTISLNNPLWFSVGTAWF